jgi:hypothetical protein
MADWTTPVAQLFSGQKIRRYLHGTIPPMATPCNADHTLDEEGIRAYTDFLIERQKADTLFVRTVERDRLGPELSALRGTKGRQRTAVHENPGQAHHRGADEPHGARAGRSSCPVPPLGCV